MLIIVCKATNPQCFRKPTHRFDGYPPNPNPKIISWSQGMEQTRLGNEISPFDLVIQNETKSFEVRIFKEADLHRMS